ncbi:putative zinc finger protein [Babesia divergens]|uniref:E3 ubiquitin-protein ligase CHFR n=1 Tax=Babesia divergens TaxID=32595 RepID=A0AAD9LGY9_BABDI|nr:putative zinc finger protein [Babesia divergens]
MERRPSPLATTDNKRACDDSVCDEPLEGSIDTDTKREASPVCDEAVPTSSVKRRSLGAAMELHQKRPALPDSGAFAHEEEPMTVGLLSQGHRQDDVRVQRPQTDYANVLVHYQQDAEGTQRLNTTFSGMSAVSSCASLLLEGGQMGPEQIVPVEHLPLCMNRQQVHDLQSAPVERRTTVCVNQSSIATRGSSCPTQGNCHERGEYGAHPCIIDTFEPSLNRLSSNSMQDVSMGESNIDNGHLQENSNISASPQTRDMEMHEEHGIGLSESYTGGNDYGIMSQMANPVCMNQLEDTAILDTMLGPFRSMEDSMINMMDSNGDINDQIDAAPNLEMRRLSNGSVNLASDCGDVKRQIVVDENLTNTILKDLICAICLEYFYFPVTLGCGHTFCRYCIGHLRLAGKLCPLCRKEVGRPPSVNTIIWNLIKALKIRKRPSPLPSPPDISFEEEKAWWDEHCLKPFMSLPLFLRIMFGDIVQTPPFFDDVCTCVVDYFDRNNRWSKTKWIFTLEDARVLRRLVGFDSEDMNVTSTRLHVWVENYLSSNPQLCCGVEDPYPLVLKIYSDINHKIDGISFNALNIQHRLPWDAGRHQKSLLHLPHSSVSLSHLVFAPCGQGQMGLLDCGSTIGTMIKLQGQRTLQHGDRIHVGDKHEVDVILTSEQPDVSYDHLRWDPQRKEVVDLNALDDEASDASYLEPIDCPLKLRIYADAQEERDVWTCPKGIILGRGPQTQSDFKKLSITTQNGYISREHCLIYYDGSRPVGQRWILRDMSTLGTFLKVKPFQPPVPIEPGFIFKVGQCKVEVCNANEGMHRRASNSPAALILSQLIHNHFSNVAVAMPMTQGETTNAQPSNNEPSEE